MAPPTHLSERMTEEAIDLGEALLAMPAPSESGEEAWKNGVCYAITFMTQRDFHQGLITRKQAASIIEAIGGDPLDVLGDPSQKKKGWPDVPNMKRS